MDVQQIFYIVASIFLAVGILFQLALIVLSIIAVRKIMKISKNVSHSIDELEDIKNHPWQFLKNTGRFIARKIISVVEPYAANRKQKSYG